VDKSPRELIAATLSIVIEIGEATGAADDGPLRVVQRWRFRHRGTQHSVDGALVEALDGALYALSRTAEEEVGEIARGLGSSDVDTLRFLACRAYTAAGSYADEAIDWLVADPANLELGWSDSPAWATRELIERTAERCSEQKLHDLAALLLDHWPVWEQSSEPDLRRVGLSQYVLLSAIPAHRRSPTVDRRLGELDRRFGQDRIRPPGRGAAASFIGPPIRPDAAARMSDAQWIGAMRRWHNDATNWSSMPPTGGAHELSRVLKARAEENPQRFGALAMQLDRSFNVAYVEALVEGAAPGVDVDSRAALLRHVANLHGLSLGRTICWTIESTADDVNASIIELIDRFAADPDPPQDDPHDVSRDDGAYRVESRALNSTRGAAARACAAVLFASSVHVRALEPILQRLASDPTRAVRTAASTAVLALSNHDRSTAQRLAEEILAHPDVDIYDSRMIEEMLTYVGMWDPERSAPLITRALDGPGHVSQRGGFVWAVLSNRGDLPATLPSMVEQLPAAARIGAAQVMASWVEGDPASLCSLFDDADPLVTAEAAAFLDHLDDVPASTTDLLLGRFVESEVFTQHKEDALRPTREVARRIDRCCPRNVRTSP
jgi:hypothetical protein